MKIDFSVTQLIPRRVNGLERHLPGPHLPKPVPNWLTHPDTKCPLLSGSQTFTRLAFADWIGAKSAVRSVRENHLARQLSGTAANEFYWPRAGTRQSLLLACAISEIVGGHLRRLETGTPPQQ